MLKSDTEKGQEFLMQYLSQTYIDGRSACQNTREYIHQSTIQAKMYDDPVTINDINCALRGSKNNTPGPDGAWYRNIMQLSDAEMLYVVKDFNVCNKTFKVPDWLHRYLQPAQKPERDASQPSS
ncbi:hypothetical protein BsWGS_21770 [Bradybaena similaris]